MLNAELRARIRDLARGIVEGSLPAYETGLKIQGLAMVNAVDRDTMITDEEAWALWLLWGQLTDRIELRPHETRDAEADIVAVANAWLSVELDPDRAVDWLRHETLRRGLRTEDAT